MRIVRFTPGPDAGLGQDPLFGVLEDDGLISIISGDPIYSGIQKTAATIPLNKVRLLAPIIPRSKVVCVGKNYADHAAEMGGVVPEEPVIFLKPNYLTQLLLNHLEITLMVLPGSHRTCARTHLPYSFGLRFNSVIGFHSLSGVRVFFGESIKASNTQKVPMYPNNIHGKTRRPKIYAHSPAKSPKNRCFKSNANIGKD